MRRSLLALLTVAVLAPAPAHAEPFHDSDPGGDVQRLTRSGDGDDYMPAPTRANPDIISASVRHGRSKLAVTVRFDDLFIPPGVGNFFIVAGDVRSDTRGAGFDMMADHRRRQGKVVVLQRGRRCLGSSRIDYERDVVRIVVPRRCLGDPGWVRVSVEAWTADEAFVWEDNAWQSGFLRDRYSPQLTAG